MRTAATIAIALLAVVDLFQLGLAFGAPWGRAAWGGRNDGVLPLRFRVASGVAGIVVYPVIGVVVADSGGIVELGVGGNAVMWILSGLFTLGTVANAASRSPVERWWAPVSFAVAICCAVIAAS